MLFLPPNQQRQSTEGTQINRQRQTDKQTKVFKNQQFTAALAAVFRPRIEVSCSSPWSVTLL